MIKVGRHVFVRSYRPPAPTTDSGGRVTGYKLNGYRLIVGTVVGYEDGDLLIAVKNAYKSPWRKKPTEVFTSRKAGEAFVKQGCDALLASIDSLRSSPSIME